MTFEDIYLSATEGVELSAAFSAPFEGRNFTGELVEKAPDGSYMAFRLADDGEGNQPVFVVYASEACTFSAATPDLGLARMMKRAEVNAVRQRYQDSGAQTPYGKVDSNETAKINIAGATQMADRALARAAREGTTCTWSIDWTMHADNSVPVVTFDALTMGDVGDLVGVHIGTCHGIGRALKAQIDALTDPVAVMAIDVEGTFAAYLGAM